MTSSSSTARKTISPVRTRRPGPREPNGQLRRIPLKQATAEIIAIARHQPHRKGSTDPRLSALIGRLVVAEAPAKPVVQVEGFTQQDLYDLAQKFLAFYGRYQAALASRRPLAVTGGGALRPDPDPVAEQRAIDAWASVSRALRDAGERVEKAAHAAIIDAAPEADQRTMAAWVTLSLPEAFRVLDAHFRGKR